MDKCSKHEQCTSKHWLQSTNNLGVLNDFSNINDFFGSQRSSLVDLKDYSKQKIWLAVVSDGSNDRVPSYDGIEGKYEIRRFK